MLLDSNIFIYAVLAEHRSLREWCFQQQVWASEITRLEVLGYHRLSELDQRDLTQLFALANIHPVSSQVVSQAIQLRQQRKMSLGDAVIAATALEYRQTLATRNVKDFDWIEGLQTIDPLKE